MLSVGINLLMVIVNILKLPIILFIAFISIMGLLCTVHIFFRYQKGERLPKGKVFKHKPKGIIRQLFIDVPRQYVSDLFSRPVNFFNPQGCHIFCGEQGSGKTIAMVEMMMRLQNNYPAAKCITNLGYTKEDDVLGDWRQLIDYKNGFEGVIVGIDEIQNWFMSGNVQLPPEMLEIITQNRKNRRIICCTAQVFTRVSKAIREQVTLCYEPHTFAGCFTVVMKYKHVLDSEGAVKERKYKGMYAFTHTKELREAYDTYKVIHTLGKGDFKAPAQPINVNNYLVQSKKAR